MPKLTTEKTKRKVKSIKKTLKSASATPRKRGRPSKLEKLKNKIKRGRPKKVVSVSIDAPVCA